MKTNYLIFLLFVSFNSLFGQFKPTYFTSKDTTVLKNLPNKKYSNLPTNTLEWKLAYQLCEFFEAKVPFEDFNQAYKFVKGKFKNKLVIHNYLQQEASKYKYSNYVSLDSLFNDKNNSETYSEEYNIFVLDFNLDEKADVIGFRNMYFGPTMGIKSWARTLKGFVPFSDMFGDFVKLDKIKEECKFYFSGGIIDPSETQIQVLYYFDFKKKFGTVEKLYYAQQTVFPTKYSTQGINFTTNEEIIVRYSPKIIESSTEDLTATIKGNIIAKLGKGTSFDILAEEGDFQFISTTYAKINETSLRHGMDEDYITEKEITVRKGPISIVGWIKKIKVD